MYESIVIWTLFSKWPVKIKKGRWSKLDLFSILENVQGILSFQLINNDNKHLCTKIVNQVKAKV